MFVLIKKDMRCSHGFKPLHINKFENYAMNMLGKLRDPGWKSQNAYTGADYFFQLVSEKLPTPHHAGTNLQEPKDPDDTDEMNIYRNERLHCMFRPKVLELYLLYFYVFLSIVFLRFCEAFCVLCMATVIVQCFCLRVSGFWDFCLAL